MSSLSNNNTAANAHLPENHGQKVSGISTGAQLLKAAVNEEVVQRHGCTKASDAAHTACDNVCGGPYNKAKYGGTDTTYGTAMHMASTGTGTGTTSFGSNTACDTKQCDNTGMRQGCTKTTDTSHKACDKACGGNLTGTNTGMRQGCTKTTDTSHKVCDKACGGDVTHGAKAEMAMERAKDHNLPMGQRISAGATGVKEKIQAAFSSGEKAHSQGSTTH